jgi:hypothetical protein
LEVLDSQSFHRRFRQYRKKPSCSKLNDVQQPTQRGEPTQRGAAGFCMPFILSKLDSQPLFRDSPPLSSPRFPEIQSCIFPTRDSLESNGVSSRRIKRFVACTPAGRDERQAYFNQGGQCGIARFSLHKMMIASVMIILYLIFVYRKVRVLFIPLF